MRIVRRIIAALFLPLVILVPTVIGTLAAIIFTPPGHALLARIATKWITDAVAGRVEIGKVSGNIWEHIDLRDVVVRDSAGAVVLSSPHIEASYILLELLANRLVFSNVKVDTLVLHLVRLDSIGKWNYERVFHIGEGPASGNAPPLVSFKGLRITSGSIRLDVPTTPGPLRLPVSRNGRPPAQPRIDTVASGIVRVYTFTDVNANLRTLQISTPERDPVLADIIDLRVKVSDPDITITQLAGAVTTLHDSLRFRFDSASMPGSRLVGGGTIRWPQDTILADFTLAAPRVALRDLWWITPDLPDWRGRGHIVATSYGNSRTDYKLDNLDVGDGTARATGKVRLQVEAVRGLGMRDLDMDLRSAPINLLRPFLDTLPVSGTLTGHLLADGFLDSLRLGGDMFFADALVPGSPTSHLRIDGTIRFGGTEGAVFQQFKLSQSTVALGTVHQLVPSVLITGALRLSGELNGAWQNATFIGSAEHAAPDSAVSRMIGKVRLDSRSFVLGLGLDADFDQLSFAALRSGYPTLPARGGLTGHVIANGNLDSLDINASLTGEIGTFTAVGRVKVNAPNYGADSLVVVMQRVDLQAITDTGMSTALNGRLVVRGTIDSGAAPSGRLDVALDRSRFGGATVDAVTGIVRADRGMLFVDTGTVLWSNGRVDAHGTLGWAAPDSGTLTVGATVTSLAPFDSLVRAMTGLATDSLRPNKLGGEAHASLQVLGSLPAPTITGSIDGTQLILDSWHASVLHATIRADSLGHRGIVILADIDTVGTGAHVADKVHLRASGTPDSLSVAGTVQMVGLNGSGGGTLITRPSESDVSVDSLTLVFPHQGWRLAKPTSMSLANSQLTFVDTLHLQSTDGSGDVRVTGTTPSDVPGKIDVSVKGLDLLGVFGVLARDSMALDGWGSLELHLAGTRDAPTFNGTAAIISPVIGELHAPSVQATFDYAASRLKSTVSLWKAGESVLEGTASLPLDLALARRDTRKLDGPLEISAKADSVDMVILGALIPSIQRPTGAFSLDMSGNGTWANPALAGTVSVHNAGMFLPSLNVTYDTINGYARFSGDALAIDTLVVKGDDVGRLGITGEIRFAQLASPTMALQISANDFLAIDEPSYMTLRATGNVNLTGPVLQPVLSGNNNNDILITRSVVYFGDLLTKNVIDLDAPENASLIDLTAVQRAQLRREFSNRFLDSLQINDLHVRIGNEVWLRSAEANIQVQGELQVDKTRKVYALVGNLDTPRGTYTLRIGPINSDFVVDQGTVTYYGASNLDALLNISAHHQVRTLDGDDFNVVATITGSILEPKVDLSSPGRSLSDRDLASYVLFGQSEAQLTRSQGGSGAQNAAFSALTGLLAAELQQSVIKSGFRALTSFTIRPQLTPGATAAATQLAAGLQFGRRWFVTFDAGICFASGVGVARRNFGASVEYRMSREFRLQTAAEPVQTCTPNRAADVFTTLSRYQFSSNLLWQRDY